MLGDHRQTQPEAELTLVAIYDLTHEEIYGLTALKDRKEEQCHALFFILI